MIYKAIVLLTLCNGIVQAESLKVTLLGTGSVGPQLDRFGPSILIEAGTRKLLFDCGRGALIRLKQLQAPIGDVNPLFLTHLHSDHVVGVPDFWLTGSIVGRREVPLQVFGPKGTKKMMAHLGRAYQLDIQNRLRMTRVRLPQEGSAIVAKDIAPGQVYVHEGLKVTAFEVIHSMEPPLGYRIDYGEYSVVLSGDTGPSESLIRASAGVDLLVHEVSYYRPPPGVRKGHTTPEDAGEIFTRLQPRLAVYSHIQFLGATVEDLIQDTRETYAGPLEVGEDLMTIEVGEEIQVRRSTE